jgi:hypothetical protein
LDGFLDCDQTARAIGAMAIGPYEEDELGVIGGAHVPDENTGYF